MKREGVAELGFSGQAAGISPNRPLRRLNSDKISSIRAQIRPCRPAAFPHPGSDASASQIEGAHLDQQSLQHFSCPRTCSRLIPPLPYRCAQGRSSCSLVAAAAAAAALPGCAADSHTPLPAPAGLLASVASLASVRSHSCAVPPHPGPPSAACCVDLPRFVGQFLV